MARFSIALLACLHGSICLYQGEELGLEEAELAFEDLRDPYGIRFWPGFKGRDGCRTPMVWSSGEPNGGFTMGKPWLPVPETHRARAVDVQERDGDSILARYRAVLAFRREHPALIVGTIEMLDAGTDQLAFMREAGNERLLCVFNFAATAAEWSMPVGIGRLVPIDFPGSDATVEGDRISLPPYGVLVARLE